MKFIDENYKPLENNEGINTKLFWVYDFDKKDMFVRKYDYWYHINTLSYVLRIKNKNIIVPANFYICIGDVDCGLDTITPAEILNREFDTVIFNNKFLADSIRYEPITVAGCVENSTFLFPMTKCLIPIAIDDNYCMFISSHDFYNKIKKINFKDIM